MNDEIVTIKISNSHLKLFQALGEKIQRAIDDNEHTKQQYEAWKEFEQSPERVSNRREERDAKRGTYPCGCAKRLKLNTDYEVTGINYRNKMNGVYFKISSAVRELTSLGLMEAFESLSMKGSGK